MLFADVALAARIEAAECRLLADGVASAARRHPATAPFATPLAGGVATFSAPGSPLNKVAGLGFGGPLDEPALEEIERAYEERGTPVRVEASSLGDPAVVRTLSRRAYAIQGFENVLGRRLPAGDLPQRAPGIEIASSPLGQLPAWLDVVVSGFATPDEQGVPSDESFSREDLADVIADMAAADGFSRFLARRGGIPAGGASLRLSEGVAHLCGAATLPAHRRRGVQTALLSERLAVAAAAGCDVAVVVTQPGSKSQENVQRQGFELLYSRAVLVRER